MEIMFKCKSNQLPKTLYYFFFHFIIKKIKTSHHGPRWVLSYHPNLILATSLSSASLSSTPFGLLSLPWIFQVLSMQKFSLQVSAQTSSSQVEAENDTFLVFLTIVNYLIHCFLLSSFWIFLFKHYASWGQEPLPSIVSEGLEHDRCPRKIFLNE